MTVDNLAIVFAPNLVRPKQETIATMLGDAQYSRAFVSSIINDPAFFFGAEPDPDVAIGEETEAAMAGREIPPVPPTRPAQGATPPPIVPHRHAPQPPNAPKPALPQTTRPPGQRPSGGPLGRGVPPGPGRGRPSAGGRGMPPGPGRGGRPSGGGRGQPGPGRGQPIANQPQRPAPVARGNLTRSETSVRASPNEPIDRRRSKSQEEALFKRNLTETSLPQRAPARPAPNLPRGDTPLGRPETPAPAGSSIPNKIERSNTTMDIKPDSISPQVSYRVRCFSFLFHCFSYFFT